mgnify:CR=1 FL=1
MNIIRQVAPAGAPLIADFIVDDDGSITKIKIHPVIGEKVLAEMPPFPYDRELIEEAQERIRKNPDNFNLPKLDN